MTSKKSILKLEIINILLILIIGVILHFTYEWSGNNKFVGIFSAINESTWEHLKILFFPMFITTIIGYFYSKELVSNYLCVKTKALFVALSFIVIFFYTYTGVIGKNITILNIGSFVVAIIIQAIYTIKHINNHSKCNNLLTLAIWMILTILFIAFTFTPPLIGLFKDPINNSYGISNKK